MRLTYILAVTVVATLHYSATASPSVKDSKVAIENGAVPAIVDSTFAEGGRMLRWVEKYEEDLDDDDEDVDEERTLGDALMKANPLRFVKKGAKMTAAQAAKVK
ncbi:hypothetical protein V7S43_004766 [Phytophthora oleae]|uniref:RxLR effector protein n=1 Tax=Phytophthora oleae TaxID=2107226 RepID=A0ABD3FWV4_9STRA